MKKTLLITGALLTLMAGAAIAAPGINLSWDDCGLNGLVDKTFLCDVNTGGDALVGSFVGPGCGLDSLNGSEMVVDLQFAGAIVPPWWDLKNAGSCRPTGSSVSFDFTAMGNCADYWHGTAIGGYVWQMGFGAANRARMKAVCAIAPTAAGPWNNQPETYAFQFTVNHTKTVGSGFCDGCLVSGCMVFNTIRLTQNAGATRPADAYCFNGYGGTKVITAPYTRNYVSWQGGIPNCGNFTTPTRNATWGQVKSLYR
jgi:hypothetical protein